MPATWFLLLVLAGGLWWVLRSFHATREHDKALTRMEQAEELPGERLSTFPSRYTWAVPLLAGTVFAAVIVVWHWRTPYAFALAALSGVLALLAEEITAGARVARMEQHVWRPGIHSAPSWREFLPVCAWAKTHVL